jgi:hypothetical protein
VALRSGKVGRSGVRGPAGVVVGLAAAASVGGIAMATMTALVLPGRAAAVRGDAAITEPTTAELNGDGRRRGPHDARSGAASATCCRCGHDAAAHEHFRPGSDCGTCGAARCDRFRAARGGAARIMTGLIGRLG